MDYSPLHASLSNFDSSVLDSLTDMVSFPSSVFLQQLCTIIIHLLSSPI